MRMNADAERCLSRVNILITEGRMWAASVWALLYLGKSVLRHLPNLIYPHQVGCAMRMASRCWLPTRQYEGTTLPAASPPHEEFRPGAVRREFTEPAHPIASLFAGANAALAELIELVKLGKLKLEL